ncbi:MAG: hypothetical protein R3C14_49170 [Caldilineaceae bacterium]
MSVAELTPLVDALPRVEKFQLLQFLIASLAKEEDIPLLDPAVTYPLWTPYNTPVETVTTLAALLAEDNHAH